MQRPFNIESQKIQINVVESGLWVIQSQQSEHYDIQLKHASQEFKDSILVGEPIYLSAGVHELWVSTLAQDLWVDLSIKKLSDSALLELNQPYSVEIPAQQQRWYQLATTRGDVFEWLGNHGADISVDLFDAYGQEIQNLGESSVFEQSNRQQSLYVRLSNHSLTDVMSVDFSVNNRSQGVDSPLIGTNVQLDMLYQLESVRQKYVFEVAEAQLVYIFASDDVFPVIKKGEYEFIYAVEQMNASSEPPMLLPTPISGSDGEFSNNEDDGLDGYLPTASLQMYAYYLAAGRYELSFDAFDQPASFEFILHRPSATPVIASDQVVSLNEPSSVLSWRFEATEHAAQQVVADGLSESDIIYVLDAAGQVVFRQTGQDFVLEPVPSFDTHPGLYQILVFKSDALASDASFSIIQQQTLSPEVYVDVFALGTLGPTQQIQHTVNIPANTQEYIITFDVETPSYWMMELDAADDEVSYYYLAAGQRVLQGSGSYFERFYLPGQYQIVISPESQETTELSFNLMSLRSASTEFDALAPALTVNYYSDEFYSDSWMLYRYNPNQASTLSLITTDAGYQLDIYNSNGYLETLNQEDLANFVFESGDYYISISKYLELGQELSEQPVSIEIEIASVNSGINGNTLVIDEKIAVSSQQTYSFSIENDGWFLLDTPDPTYGSASTVELQGPQGLNLINVYQNFNSGEAESFSESGSNELSAIWLVKGEYSLRFNGFAEGSQFGVISLARPDVAVLQPNDAVSIAANEANYAVYNLTFSLDQKYLLDFSVLGSSPELSAFSSFPISNTSPEYWLFNQKTGALLESKALYYSGFLKLEGLTGDYVLLVKHQNPSTELSLTLRQFDAGQSMLNSQGTNSVAVAPFGDQQSFRLIVEQPQKIEFSNFDGLQIELVDAITSSYVHLKTDITGHRYAYLGAGYYDVVVSGFVEGQYQYTFEAQTSNYLPQAELGFDGSQTVDLAQPNQRLLLNLQAGQTVFLNALTPADYGSSVWMDVYDPFGQLLETKLLGRQSYYSGSQQSHVFTPDLTGAYVLDFRIRTGQSWSNQGSMIAFEMRTVDTLQSTLADQPVRATIAQIEDQHIYQFTLADATNVALNLQGANYQFELWCLDGIPQKLTTYSASREPVIRQLGAGNYQLVVRSTVDSNNQAYLIQSISASSLNVQPPHISSSSNVENGSEISAWKIKAQAGLELNFSFEVFNTVPNTSVTWNIFSPSGEKISTYHQYTSQKSNYKFNPSESGDYILTVHNRYDDQKARHVGVTYQPVEQLVVPITVNQAVDVSSLAAHQRMTYQLQIDSPQWIVFDVKKLTAATLQLSGADIDARALNSGLQYLYLQAGQYTINAASSNGLGSYQFNLTDLQTRTTWSAANSSVTTVPLGQTVLELDVVSGQEYQLDLRLQNGYGFGYYVLLDEAGRDYLGLQQVYYSNPKKFIAANTAKLQLVLLNQLTSQQLFTDVTLWPVQKLDLVLPPQQLVSGIISTQYDQLVYQIDQPADGILKISNLNLDAGVRVQLLGLINDTVIHEFSVANIGQALQLNAGQYRLKLSATNVSTPQAFEFSYLNSAVSGMTPDSAVEIALVQDQVVRLAAGAVNQNSAGSNWYRVLVHEGDQIALSNLSQIPTQALRLYDNAGQLVSWVEQSGQLRSTSLTTGYYDLEVVQTAVADASNYHVDLQRLTQSPALERGVDLADYLVDAKEVALSTGQTTELLINIGDGATGTRDVDFVKVLLAENEEIQIVASYSQGAYPYIRVFGADGALQQGYSVTFKALSAGYYYIGISDYNNTSYDPNTADSRTVGNIGQALVSIVKGLSTASSPFYTMFNQADVVEVYNQHIVDPLVGYQAKSYEIDIDQAGLWSVNNLGDSLSNIILRVVDQTGRVVISDPRQAHHLDIGKYTVQILNKNYYSTSVDLKLNNLSTATAIDFAQSVELAKDNSTQAVSYQFLAEQGDSIQFNSLGYTGSVGSTRWSIYNQSGQLIMSSDVMTDGKLLPISATGRYFIVFDQNDSYDRGALQVVFQLDRLAQQQPAVIGSNQQINLQLNAAQQKQEYSLHLDQSTEFWVDAVLNNATVQLIDQSNQQAISLQHAQLLQLKSGDYLVRVTSPDFNERSVQFKLNDLAQAAPLISSQPIAADLSPEGLSKTYQITAATGDLIFIDFEDVLARVYQGYPTYGYNYTATVSIVDPYGRTVVSNAGDLSDQKFVASTDGVYTVVVSTSQPVETVVPFTMAVYVHAPKQPILIDLTAQSNLADLAVTNVALSATDIVQSGDLLTVTWTVENRGQQTVTGDFIDRVWVRNQLTGQVIAETISPYQVAQQGEVLVGQAVQRTATLRLPHGAYGTGQFELIVQTNATGTVQESSQNLSNNQSTVPFESQLAAYANLVVDGIQMQPQQPTWSAGDTVEFSWVVQNQGTRDAVGTWHERLEVVNSLTGQVIVSEALTMPDQNLQANTAIQRSWSISWPAGLQSTGRFYVRVSIDTTAQIPEFSAIGALQEDDNQQQQTFTYAPDLLIEHLRIQNPSVQAGDNLVLLWDELNQGNQDVKTAYQTRILVQPRLENGQLGTAVINTVVTQPMSAVLPTGGRLERSWSVKLPDGLKGTGDFMVSVTVDSNVLGQGAIFEVNAAGNAELNNTQSVQLVAQPQQYADLRVKSIQAPTLINAGQTFDLSWVIENIGSKAAEGSWIDRVILTKDAVFGNADDVVLSNVLQTSVLDINGVYTKTITLTAATRLEGLYRITVVTDAERKVLEPDTMANNILVSDLITIQPQYADLNVTQVSVDQQPKAGRSIDVSWVVNNQGTVATDINRWIDRVYLSHSATDLSAALLLGSVTHVGVLAVDSSYVASTNVRLPIDWVGQQYLIVVSDANQQAYEIERNNNQSQGLSIEVQPEPKADLTISQFEIEGEWKAGNTVTIRYDIQNIGNDIANVWMHDRLKLTQINGMHQQFTVPLPAGVRTVGIGQTIQFTTQYVVPALATGAWDLELLLDAGNALSEANELNNQRIIRIEVISPDLIVDSIQTVGELRGGSSIALTWQTKNQGAAEAISVVDRIYLAKNGVIDTQAIKLGELNHPTIAAGLSLETSLQVTLPVDLVGIWTLVVVTDAKATVAEQDAEDNNQTALLLDIQEYQYADLKIDSLIMPSQVIADPATVRIEWTVQNIGLGKGKTLSWTDQVIFSTDEVLGNDDDVLLGTFDHVGGLDVGDSYQGELTYRFGPNFSKRGYIFVAADAGKQVWESGQDSNNAQHQMIDVMPRPYADLIVEQVSSSQQASSGQALTVSWSVLNQGIGITDRTVWTDVVWLTEHADGSGQKWKLSELAHLGRLSAQDRYTASTVVILPEGLEGNYYLQVETNQKGSAYEFIFDTNNKTSVQLPIQLTPSPDLVVESIIFPATAQEGGKVSLTWTVLNQGQQVAEGIWVDSLKLVSAVDSSRIVDLGQYTYTQNLLAGQRYTRSEQVSLPTRLEGLWRLEVVTNRLLGSTQDNQVYEHAQAGQNNTRLSDEVMAVELLPRPDLRIGDIEVPEHVSAGGRLAIKFQVSNFGAVATTQQWQDAVYLSLDGQLSSDDLLLGRLENGSALATGESYTSMLNDIAIPLRYRGEVYLIVSADERSQLIEYPNENNNIKLEKITIDAIPFADLVTSDVNVADQLVSGAVVNVTYKVSNLGSATTLAENATVDRWVDAVWLTVDGKRPSLAKGDIYLGNITHQGHLAVGEDYLTQVDVKIPDGVRSGRYYLTVWSDTYNVILEDTLASNINLDDPTQVDNNNYKSKAVDVLGVTPPDLLVTHVAAAPVMNATEGKYAFSYTVKNRASAVEGQWRDRVWLSDHPDLRLAKTSWILGEYQQQRSLNNGEEYTVSQEVDLAPSVSGLYLIVETNYLSGSTNRYITNTDNLKVYEIDGLNNFKASASHITAQPADLQVQNVVTSPDNFSGEKTQMSWTVKNLGADVWDQTKQWVDSVYISTDPEFIADRAILLGSVIHYNLNGLKSQEAYTSIGLFSLPQGYDGQYYVHVIADAVENGVGDKAKPQPEWWNKNNLLNHDIDAEQKPHGAAIFYQKSVFEGAFNTNNMGQATLAVSYREPDLKVDQIVLSNPNPKAGDTITVTWTATNYGNRATRQSSWLDGVYLSNDATLDASDYPAVDRGTDLERRFGVRQTSLGADANKQPRYLQPGESYTNSATFTLPTSIGGDFYILVKADTELFDAVLSRTSDQVSSIRTGLKTVYGDGTGVVAEF